MVGLNLNCFRAVLYKKNNSLGMRLHWALPLQVTRGLRICSYTVILNRVVQVLPALLTAFVSCLYITN